MHTKQMIQMLELPTLHHLMVMMELLQWLDPTVIMDIIHLMVMVMVLMVNGSEDDPGSGFDVAGVNQTNSKITPSKGNLVLSLVT